MSPRPTPQLDDKTLVRQLQIELELRSIQAQTHETLKAELRTHRRETGELRQSLAAVTQERDELLASVRACEGMRVIPEDEYADLKAAEHHLRRILHRINRNAVAGWLARRRTGFRAMVERWPQA